MKFSRTKNFIYVLLVITAFLLSAGWTNTATVQARGWKDRRDDQWMRDYRYDRHDRWSRREEQKGFRDGLDRGRKDARSHRVYDPNNSSHFRDGDEAYREGFRRGYAQGYNR